jgi:hypothetical protein
MLYRCVCPLVVQSFARENEVVGCQSPNPRKYVVLNQNFVFDLCDFDLRDVFQEHNPGVKRELHVLCVYIPL